MALLAGAILAALVAWSLAGATRDDSAVGLFALRFIAGLGLAALAVQSARVGAPAAALVAGPIAVVLLAGGAFDRTRTRRVPRARAAPLPPRIEVAAPAAPPARRRAA